MEISDFCNDLAAFTVGSNLATINGLVGGFALSTILPKKRPKEGPFFTGCIVNLYADIIEYTKYDQLILYNDLGYIMGIAAGMKIEELVRKYFKSNNNKISPRKDP